MHRTIAAFVLSTVVLTVPAAIAADDATTGRIGPSLRILNNGRHLTPYGRLVNVGNDSTVWANTFNGSTDDALALQDSTVRAVAAAIAATPNR